MFGPRKSLDDIRSHEASQSLAKTLSWPHLIALGVGAIVGPGIYTLTGVGADRAGPAVILAFAIAGMVCACAALPYTELPTLTPRGGTRHPFSAGLCVDNTPGVVGWVPIQPYAL